MQGPAQVQRAPAARVVAPDPAGNPPPNLVTATARLKGFPVTLPLSDISPDQVKKETESIPQPLGSDSHAAALGGDATLEKKGSQEPDAGATSQLGPSSPTFNPTPSTAPSGDPVGPTDASVYC